MGIEEKIKKTKVFDGDYEILYSKVFNVYQNKLIFKNIDGFEVTFNFIFDKNKRGGKIGLKGDNDAKKIYINLYNYNNSLGLGSGSPIAIMKTGDNRDVLFSIHVKSLNETTSFLQVSITFYLK